MLGCKSREGSTLDWAKPGGMSLKFSGLQHIKDVYDWQGAQLAYLGFDELTHFAQKQFFYLLSRLRSTCGVKPYCRATCNPDAESWVAKFIEWWIDQEEFIDGDKDQPNPNYGKAIPERAGVLRYFIRQGDDLIWGDSREELIREYGRKAAEFAHSVTFIPATVYDNKILLKKNPEYLANLQAQDRVERARLLDGNWKIKATSGTIFKRSDFRIIKTAPHCVKWIRYWDRAATVPSPSNPNPDWTVGVKMGKTADDQFVIAAVERDRKTPLGVETMIQNTASQDKCTIGLEKDPGQAGVAEAEALARKLNKYDVRIFPVHTDKITRSKAYSAQVEAHNVLLVEGDWNEAFLAEHANFPPDEKKSSRRNNTEDEDDVAGKDDQVDAASGAFNFLNGDKVGKMMPPSDNASKTFAPGFNRGSLPEW